MAHHKTLPANVRASTAQTQVGAMAEPSRIACAAWVDRMTEITPC